MHRRNLLYHRCQDWEGSCSFFESVADWLPSMGNVDFSTYLAATPVPQPADAARILVEALEGTPSLVVIDDFHKGLGHGAASNIPSHVIGFARE